jgi:hypothetical protein
MWNTPEDSPCLLTAAADAVNAVRAVPIKKRQRLQPLPFLHGAVMFYTAVHIFKHEVIYYAKQTYSFADKRNDNRKNHLYSTYAL